MQDRLAELNAGISSSDVRVLVYTSLATDH